MSEERYTYSVHPSKPIRNLVPGKNINKPISMKLTKEEVMSAMTCGPVFRVFPGQSPIRVTGSNLNSLHVPSKAAKNVAKRESKGNSTDVAKVEQIQEVILPEEPKIEVPTEPIQEVQQEIPVQEEIIEETPVQEEEVVEEVIEESIPEEIEIPVSSSEEIEEEEIEEEVIEENPDGTKQVTRKKKRHKR